MLSGSPWSLRSPVCGVTILVGSVPESSFWVTILVGWFSLRWSPGLRPPLRWSPEVRGICTVGVDWSLRWSLLLRWSPFCTGVSLGKFHSQEPFFPMPPTRALSTPISLAARRSVVSLYPHCRPSSMTSLEGHDPLERMFLKKSLASSLVVRSYGSGIERIALASKSTSPSQVKYPSSEK